MILDKKPLTLGEVKKYVEGLESKEPLMEYLKKFGKLSSEEAIKLKEALVSLNNPKIREEGIVKAVDFLPKDVEDVNKIFSDSNLNDEEANALLKVIKGN